MPSEQELIEKFSEMDTDGSGCLSLAEIKTGFAHLGFPNEFADEFMANFDIDADGKISLDEYKEKLNLIPPKEHKGAAWRQVFQEFDLDKSGKISAEELQKVLLEQKTHHDVEELKRWIAARDTDGDGEVDYEEFLSFLHLQD